jgi:hypothetical protein
LRDHRDPDPAIEANPDADARLTFISTDDLAREFIRRRRAATERAAIMLEADNMANAMAAVRRQSARRR